MAYYITGDTHRDFERIVKFCEQNDTSTEDVMIILGDAGHYHCESDEDGIRIMFEDYEEII